MTALWRQYLAARGATELDFAIQGAARRLAVRWSPQSSTGKEALELLSASLEPEVLELVRQGELHLSSAARLPALRITTVTELDLWRRGVPREWWSSWEWSE